MVAYPGIYLLEIKPQSSQYASVNITYHTENKDRLYNPKSVISETISCSKSDFRSYAVKAIKMQNLFEEPREFTLRSQSEAKKFLDHTASASSLKYDVDYSTVGTQSCNGRIPVNGASKLYLGFENVRMRYTNYLWVEAVAVIPTTEYYRTQYTVK